MKEDNKNCLQKRKSTSKSSSVKGLSPLLLGPWVFDFLFALGFVLLTFFHNRIPVPEEVSIPGDFLISFLPVLLTVIAVLFSVLGNKEQGITRKELIKLRSKWYYSFLQMTIIVMILLVCYTISVSLSLIYSQIYLLAISVVYSFVFSFQNIPLLTFYENTIEHILAQFYWNKYKGDNCNSYESGIFTRAITTYIETRGIKKAYLFLTKNAKTKEEKKGIFDYLFKRMSKDYSLKVNASDCQFTQEDGVSAISFLNEGFTNIADLLSFSKDFDASLEMEEMNELEMVLPLLSLYRISKKLGLTQKDEDCWLTLGESVIDGIKAGGSKEKAMANFLNGLITNFSEGVEIFGIISTSTYFGNFFTKREIIPYPFFYSIFLNYLSDHGGEKIVNSVIRREVKGLQSGWIDFVSSIFHRDTIEKYSETLPKMLEVYRASESNSFHRIGGEDSDFFGSQNIIGIWLEVFLYSPYILIDDSLGVMIRKLSVSDQGALFDAFESGETKEGISFMKTYSIYSEGELAYERESEKRAIIKKIQKDLSIEKENTNNK